MSTSHTEHVAAHDGGGFDAFRAVPEGGTGPGILLFAHAFSNWDAPSMCDRPAADLAWRRTLDFFAEHLR